MTINIWGMIRLVESRGKRDDNIFPALQGLVCVGQAERTSRYQIVHTRFLEETRRLAADADIRNSIYAGDGKVMMAAMNAAISVSQAELVVSFREVKLNLEEMRAFLDELGHEAALSSRIVLTTPEGEQWEVATEDDLSEVAAHFLSSDRVVGWLKDDLKRRDPVTASGR